MLNSVASPVTSQSKPIYRLMRESHQLLIDLQRPDGH